MIRGNFQIPACHYRKSDPLPQEWCLQPPTSRNSRYQHVTTERVTHYPKSGASSPVPVLAALTDTELQIPACHYRKSDPLPQEWCLQPPTSRNSRYQHVTTERVTHYPKSGASSPVPVLAALTDTELQIPACHYRKSDPLPQEWCLQSSSSCFLPQPLPQERCIVMAPYIGTSFTSWCMGEHWFTCPTLQEPPSREDF